MNETPDPRRALPPIVRGMRWQFILLALVFLGIGLLYSRVSTTYFCSYDDFDEVHRAAFQDHVNPAEIFTTSHWRSYKYRPLNRGANYLTHILSSGSASAFRVRNLLFHLINVGLIFIIARQLNLSPSGALLAALIFGIHPMANQSVIGAVMTNTMAYTAYFGAIAAYFAAIGRRGIAGVRWIVLAVLAAAVALYLYDSAIAIFGLIGWAVLLYRWRRGSWPFDPRMRVIGILATIAVFASYALIRFLVVPRGTTGSSTEIATLGMMIRNAVMYTVALINPLDLVLAHEWIGSPLPPDILLRRSLPMAVGAILVAVFLVAMSGRIFVWFRRAPETAKVVDVERTLFLVAGIILPLLPVLVLSSHPSETYLYASAAFYALLLVSLATPVYGHLSENQRTVARACAVILIGLYSAATWERNSLVYECGVVANRIIRSITTGTESTFLVTDVGSADAPAPYGYYRFAGLATIGDQGHAENAMTHAIQLVTGDTKTQARVVDWSTLKRECPDNPGTACLMVYPDGHVTRYSNSAVR